MIDWESFSDENKLPIVNEDMWSIVCELYGVENVIDNLVDYLIENCYTLPDCQKTEDECKKRFIKLYNDDLEDQLLDAKPVFSLEYQDIGESLGILQMGSYYNYISDYFQRQHRMKCGRNSKYSPFTVWTGYKLDKKKHKEVLRQALQGLKHDKKLDYTSYKTCLRLASNCYTAPQFRVHSAKKLYQYFNAEKIIDFSAGWGDRLAAFFCNKSSKEYLGIDPNVFTFEEYMKQCRIYDRWRFECENNSLDYIEPDLDYQWHYFIFTSRSTGIKVIIYNLPAENVNLQDYENYDLVFTSPPYYNIEKYCEHSRAREMQSWYRYTTPEEWLDKFLKPVVLKTRNCLKKEGYIAINIIDIDLGKKKGRMEIYNYLRDILHENTFIGNMGLRMKKRPGSKVDEMSSEPIWIWKI